MKKYSIIFCISAFGIYACGQFKTKEYPDTRYIPTGNTEPDEGKIKGDIYHSEEIGWTIEIPKGWIITDRNELDRREDIGKKAIGENMGIESDLEVEGLKNLLNFQKDQFNVFTSTSQPFEITYPGEYDDANKFVKELLYTTYQSEGIKADTNSTMISFNGREFYVFHCDIYDPNGKDVILQQTMFSQLIRGYDVGVAITYNNDQDRDVLINTLKTSRFD